MNVHLSEEQLAALLMGEVEERKGAEAHLRECAECGDALEEMRRILAAVEALPVPERNEAYGREVWARIEPRLQERPRGSWLPWLSPQQWAVAATMVLILFFGVLLGRFTAPPADNAQTEARIRERILLFAVGEHLDRSQLVLVELVNATGNGKVDISSEQEWAADLIADNRIYRLTAAQSGQPELAELLDQLEQVLLEVAHSPAQMDADDFDAIRSQIEEEDILFKIRVLSSQVREREGAGRQTPAPTNSQS